MGTHEAESYRCEHGPITEHPFVHKSGTQRDFRESIFRRPGVRYFRVKSDPSGMVEKAMFCQFPRDAVTAAA